MNGFMGFLILIGVLVIIVLSPLLLVFGINILLESVNHTLIPYTFKTWAGSLILLFILKSSVTYKKG